MRFLEGLITGLLLLSPYCYWLWCKWKAAEAANDNLKGFSLECLNHASHVLTDWHDANEGRD